MAVVIVEGFDVYPNVDSTSYGVVGGWNVSNPSDMQLVAGRFGGQGLQMNGDLSTTPFIGQPVASGTDFAVGCAIMLEANLPNLTAVMYFRATNSGGDVLCGLGINPSQQYYLWVGESSNIVATAANPVTVGAWHYLELIAHIDPATGTLAMWMDGIEVASFAGAIPNGPAAYFALGFDNNSFNGAQRTYDDFYLATTTTRVGEMRVETLYPNSNVQQQWTPLTGSSNFAMVDETLVDGDASYVFSTTPGNEDLYGITSLSGTPATVAAVQVRVCAEKDDSATRQLATSLVSGSTHVNGPTFTVPFDSYVYERDIYLVDPHTSAPWTGAGVNAAQIGQKVIA
jgi:hypothetical protein